MPFTRQANREEIEKAFVRARLLAPREINSAAYASSKDDTAFTLFSIKCQADQTRACTRGEYCTLAVQSRQSGIFNSPCTGIRPMFRRIRVPPRVAARSSERGQLSAAGTVP